MAKGKFVEAPRPRKGESPEQIVRERIARAEREQATELILSGLGLTSLPPEMATSRTTMISTSPRRRVSMNRRHLST